jgi:hypothetical protein
MQSTPLRTIQNLPTPKTSRRQSTGVSGGGVNMSHGDIRFFVRPQVASTQSDRTEQPYMVTASPDSSLLPATAHAHSIEPGFSQAGGFIVESQSYAVNVPVVDLTLSPEDDNVPHRFENACVSVSQIDFNPAMASTQVLDFKMPAPLASFSDVPVTLLPAINNSADENAEQKHDGISLRGSDDLHMTDGLLPAVLSTTAPECHARLATQEPVGSNGEKTDACPSFVPKLVVELKPYSDCLDNDVDVDNKLDNESSEYRSESPDLFDGEDICDGNVDAGLKLFDVCAAGNSIATKTVKQATVGKIVGDSCGTIAGHRPKDVLESNASLAEKLVRRRQASKQSPLLDDVQSNSTPRRAHSNCGEVVSLFEGTDMKSKIAEGENDSCRRSLRMKRKKNVVDVPPKPKPKRCGRGVDFLDEMDQVKYLTVYCAGVLSIVHVVFYII